MPISFDPDAARRLFESVERAMRPIDGIGTGSEPFAKAERGPVPQALADEFRRLVEGGTSAAAPEAGIEAPAASDIAGPQRAIASEAPFSMGADNDARMGTQANDLAADGAGKPQDASAPERLMTPEELLRTQMTLNMHFFEGRSLHSASEGVSSRLSETLKSSG